MNNKKIKLIAISVAMVLSTQIVLAEDVITDFGGLKDALKNATGSSVTVKLGSDISATAAITTGGSNTPKSVTILGEGKKYTSTTLAFDVKPNTTLTLNNITLDTIKHASSWGGAMYNEGTLILDNVTFNKNIAQTPKAVGGGAMALVATMEMLFLRLLKILLLLIILLNLILSTKITAGRYMFMELLGW